MFYVYLHIKETNGEPFYVGKGKNGRAYTKNSRNKYWQNIVNKCGFDVILLETNLTEDESFEKEIYWINRIGRDKLCNMNNGGKGGCSNPSNEIRLEMVRRNVGKKLSTEHKKKISEGGFGKGGKKIIIDNINYNSIKEASIVLNLTYKCLISRIKRSNNNYSHKNYKDTRKNYVNT
jgi:hypothetical protein